jgi:hypothetical protein
MKAIMTICVQFILGSTVNYFAVKGAQVENLQGARFATSRFSPKSQDESTAPLFNPQRPVNCEDFQGYLDESILQWQKLKGTYFIVLVRLGKRERDHRLNGLRLAYIEDYLNRHKVEHISAEGPRVKGLGRMEFYVGGKLLTVVPLRPNARSVCFGSTGG